MSGRPIRSRFDFELPRSETPVDFQLSQRADHIVNDIYQWVQFNRAIINARDEPLADYRKYRRLHLLIGDSNMSPFATALKVGTTACVLTLLGEGLMPYDVILRDAVQSTRDISRDQSQQLDPVRLENGQTCDALDVQYIFLKLAQQHLAGTDEETDWLIERWGFTLDAIRSKPESLIGGVDWISKKYLLDAFRAEENLELARSLAAKPRSRISQHQPDQRVVLRADACQGHRRVQRQRALRPCVAQPAGEHPRAGTLGGGQSFPKNEPVLRHQLGFDFLREPEPFCDG